LTRLTKKGKRSTALGLNIENPFSVLPLSFELSLGRDAYGEQLLIDDC
jgi:hypothetical protein